MPNVTAPIKCKALMTGVYSCEGLCVATNPLTELPLSCLLSDLVLCLHEVSRFRIWFLLMPPLILKVTHAITSQIVTLQDNARCQ